MKHQFTHPARVVEIPREERQEEDSETDEFLPRAPAATDDGTPVGAVPRADSDPR
jgi:hypothetical protein